MDPFSRGHLDWNIYFHKGEDWARSGVKSFFKLKGAKAQKGMDTMKVGPVFEFLVSNPDLPKDNYRRIVDFYGGN